MPMLLLRSSYLASLAVATKLKNVLVQQQFAYQLFVQTPDAVKLQAFCAAMRKKHSAKNYYMVVVADDDNVEFVESVECDVVDIVDDTDDCDNNDDEEEVIEGQQCKERFDKLGQLPPVVFARTRSLKRLLHIVPSLSSALMQ